jgi:hypothetical protein
MIIVCIFSFNDDDNDDNDDGSEGTYILYSRGTDGGVVEAICIVQVYDYN